MKIRTKFFIIGFLSLVLAVVFGGFVFYSSFIAAKVEAREAIAQELVLAVFERNLLLSDYYLLSRSERIKEQLLAQNKEIEDILLEAFFVFDDEDSVDALAQIQKNYDNITFELERLLASGEMLGSAGSFADTQSISRIFVMSQSTVDLTSQVASRSKAQLIQLRQGAVVSVGIFSIGGLLFAIVAILIIVSTTRKLSVLEKRVTNVAKGKFQERVEIKSKDEVGMLAQSFNAMAEKLQSLYTDLEQKVRDRTKDLSKNVKELEKVKSATLNILEDLQGEKRETVKFKQAVEFATDAVIMTTPEQKIIYCNDVCEKLGGYTRDESLGKDINKLLISPKTSKKVLAEMQATISSGKPFVTEEVIIKNKTGQEIQVELSTYPIQEGNQIKFFVGLLQDISKRKEIDRSKSEFVSLASHQLRTPITGLKWTIERFIKKEKLTKKGKEYLSDMHHSMVRLSNLVDSLLNVSRIETGSVRVNPEEFDLIKFIEDYLDETKPLQEKKNLTIEFKKETDKLKVESDINLMSNILQSLVSNAIEYTPKGGEIEVSIKSDNGKFVLKVSDNGIGVPKEDQDKLFEKFHRADNARKFKADGSGLGLYIVKKATDLLGGKISLQSEVEKGTSFIVELPLELKSLKRHRSLL